MKNILRRFYILGIILILLISGSLAAQYNYLKNINKENKEINIEKSRELLGQEINNKLKLNSQVMLSASEVFTTNICPRIDTREYFQKLLKVNPVFNAIYYIDKQNKLIMSADWDQPDEYEIKERDWYKKAEREKKLIYSEAYKDAWTKKEIITIANPIYNEENELRGIMAGDIFIEDIIDVVQTTDIDNIGYSFLIDGKGNIIDCPDCEEKYFDVKNINKIKDDLLDEMILRNKGEKQVNLGNVEGYLSYQPIEEIDWIIGSFISNEDYYEIDNELLGIFIISLIIIVSIFTGFIIMQNIYFIKPSYLLEEDIKKINIENDIKYRLSLDEEGPFYKLRKSMNKNLDKTEEFFLGQKEYQEELLASYEEVEDSYGQLSLMESELRSQYIELEKNEKRFYHLSYTDNLTGLYNRRFYLEEVEKRNNEENLPLSFIMADVNGLKLINDSFGQDAGDELLKTVGRAMEENCMKPQSISRIGGDEFIMILPRTNKEEAMDKVKAIRKTAIAKNKQGFDVSISFGVETKYRQEEDISNLLKKVEDDMYSNKLLEGPSMRSKTIETIIQTLYEKNPREEAHSARVSELCQKMGYYLEMTDEEIKELKTVGLLHDIGKVAISDQVLEKPGPLTDEEYEEIKKHPEIGYRILSTVNEMSQIAEYALAHHERCDGKGYPLGLKCEEIPTVSKIIAIADSYDAMISDRPYRKGLPKKVAREEIIKHSGSQFDPKLARIFIEKVLGEEWIEKRE